jgi:hypothetical protein
MRLKLTRKELLEVAHMTAKALDDLGIKSCIFGGVGCALYGAERKFTPTQDVDIIMITKGNWWNRTKALHWNVEYIKRLLVENDSDHFILMKPHPVKGIPPKRFKKLYYKLPSGDDSNRICKVDLVFCTTRIISISNFPVQVLSYRQNIPVAPPLTLLALKLKGWELRPNREERPDLWKKHVYTDPEDIEQLLVIASREGEHLSKVQWWPRWFKKEAQRRAKDFVEAHPRTCRRRWEELGFRV